MGAMTVPNQIPPRVPSKGGPDHIRSADNIGMWDLLLLPYYVSPLAYLTENTEFVWSGEGAVR
jgi:hypothetical protein